MTEQMNTCNGYIQPAFFNQGRLPVCQLHGVIYPFLAFLSIACLPAHFFSCAKVVAPAYEKNIATEKSRSAVSLMVKDGEGFERRCCDVLIYNADNFGRLDSFTHLDGNQKEIQVSSGSGRKTAVVICNAPEGSLKWENMLTMKSLSGVCLELENENASSPVLVGKADFDAGEEFSVTLSPLMARIRLKELSCDFRGTAYQFEELTDARVYLTNVNADWRVTGETGGSRFINNGGWNESDAVKFSSPEILCREIEGNVGMDFRELNLDLYCYPNPVGEESFGQPFTRLVIEGFVKGHRWYWPISINGLGEGGIRPNESYSLKVCLRRSGTEDPDFAIRLEKDELVMEVEKWDEKENYAVAF